MNYVLAGIELALLEWSKAYIRQKDWRRADLLSTREGKWQPQVWENLMPLEHTVLMYLLCSIVTCRVDKNISQYRLNLLHCEVCTTLCNNFQLMRMSQKAEISKTVFFSVTAFLHQLYVLMFNFKPTLDLTNTWKKQWKAMLETICHVNCRAATTVMPTTIVSRLGKKQTTREVKGHGWFGVDHKHCWHCKLT